MLSDPAEGARHHVEALASINLVNLAIDIEVMNALLLPIVLGLLLMLEAKALPPEWRMQGLRKYSTWGMCLLVIAFGGLVGCRQDRQPAFVHDQHF